MDWLICCCTRRCRCIGVFRWHWEQPPEVQSKICDNLEFVRIKLDEIKNRNNEPAISTEISKVKVRVIKTNERVDDSKNSL